MPLNDPQTWSDEVRRALERYDEALLRQVANRLFKPRNQWPVEELIERSVATVSNAPVIDRRLETLDQAGRRLLALIGHSRQPRWKLGGLMEMLVALGHDVDVRPVLGLLETGLLFPELPADLHRLRTFEQWLGVGNGVPAVFAHPHVTSRALAGDLGLPDLSAAGSPDAEGPAGGVARAGSHGSAGVHEADGLEWPLRLAAVRQQIASSPLRRTQQGDFFKRDSDRLRSDPVLGAPPAESLAELPDPGLLAVELAQAEGMISEKDGELTAATVPETWEAGLPAVLESLWAALPLLERWNCAQGWCGVPEAGNPYPAAYLLGLLALGRLPEGGWADPEAVEAWVLEHHPYWRGRTGESAPAAPLRTFLLGLAFQLRLVQAIRGGEGGWLVRLSALGRRLLGFDRAAGAAPPPAYKQTLLVQPNLEIIAYRQGLTPALIARLGRFATWKGLGPACTLQLEPDTVYRALESGLTFEAIRQTLEQHGMRPTPPAVVESLRTWADKRERLGVYPSATLFEFNTAEDLNEALARGLPGVRLSDRLALVTDEGSIDFRHFRLTGTRDYGLAPEKCVDVGDDGVTLTVDLSRSDLLLETELNRFAERLGPAEASAPKPDPNGGARSQYRLTPATLARGRDAGVGLPYLEEWFLQRTGEPLSPAARLLLTGAQTPPLPIRRQLVLDVGTPEVADGLLQWPATRSLIESRLGPTALAVAEDRLDALRLRLRELGLSSVPAEGADLAQTS